MDPELQELLAVWFGHAECPEARREALLRRLRNDPAFRREFVAEIQMHGLIRAAQSAEPRWLSLEEVLAGDSRVSEAEVETRFEDNLLARLKRSASREWGMGWWRWLLVSGAAALIALIAFQQGRDTRPPAMARPPAEPAAPMPSAAIPKAVAVLANTAGAIWEGPLQAPQPGGLLRGGRLRLRQGIAQIDFFAGAHVILRGPAELDLRAPGEAILLSGTATCRLTDQGQGFRFSAPGISLSGTREAFGLVMPVDGPPEIHALEGSLRLHAGPAVAPMELAQCTAARLAEGRFTSVPYDEPVFPSLDELKRLAQAEATQRSIDWWDHTLRWTHEPQTLLYYTFVSDVYQDQRLQNQAPDPAPGSHGMVIGCRWTDGRWPWKRALEFRQPGDRVLLALPGTHPQLSVAAWVRIDAFTQEFNTLMMSGNQTRLGLAANDSGSVEETLGARLRWELADTGAVHFNVSRAGKTAEPGWTHSTTPPLLRDNWLGQWVLLATTFDATSGRVAHYWNGRLVAESRLPDATPMALHVLEIGNLSHSTADLRNAQRRGFFGALDELLMTRRILSEAELARFHQDGRPGS